MAGAPGGARPRAQKGADLKRDPRFALHNAPIDLDMKDGDAKISGRVELVTGDDFDAYVAHLHDAAEADQPVPDDPFDLFRADVTEFVVIRLGDPADHLLIDVWQEDRGLQTYKR